MDLIVLLNKVQKLNKVIYNEHFYNNNNVIVFLGILQQLCISKKVFKKNDDLANFIETNFNVQFSKSSKTSRPNMLGKLAKHFLTEVKETDIEKYANFLDDFISKIILTLDKESVNTPKSWHDFISKMEI